MKNHNEESPRGFSKKPLIIIAAAVIIAGGATAATVTAVNYANSPSRLVSLAQKFLNDSDYERAIIEFDKVLAMDPLNVDAYIGKAEALAALGRSDEALEVLATALDMVGSTATPEDISRIRELIDSIKGESPKMGTSEPVVTEEAATMESESESATPAETEFIRTAVHADLSDGYYDGYIDEDGNYHFEENHNGDGYQYDVTEIDRIYQNDAISMCPVYHASWDYEDGVLANHEEFDYRTPGVLSYYYSNANDQAGDVRSEITYKTDENGWITQEGNCVYTYEFDEYGRLISTVISRISDDPDIATEDFDITFSVGTYAYEYGENGVLSRMTFHDNDELALELRFDEWGSTTYKFRKQSAKMNTLEEYSYDYTFGGDGTPVSAEVTCTRVRNNETGSKSFNSTYTETYTYERAQ